MLLCVRRDKTLEEWNRNEPIIEADKGPAFTSPHDDAADGAHLGEDFEELRGVNAVLPSREGDLRWRS
jgi:hypothetical protein